MALRSRRDDQDRAQRAARGQVLVLFALFLTVMVGLTALVVDFGVWLGEKRSYQNAADAAALVGVDYLRPPLSSGTASDAVLAAVTDLDRQLGLGITDLGAAAAAASSSAGFSAANDDGYTGRDTFWVTSPPDPDCGSPGSYVGNARAITVRIAHVSDRFFSSIYSGGSEAIGICATAASRAGGYAVAVLSPPVGTQPNNTNVTFDLAGANTIVKITGGDAVSNATFGAQGNPSPNAHQTPAMVQFMTPGTDLYLGILNPSPLPWTTSPAQIQDPYGAYLPPDPLTARVPIPGWGPGPWVDNDASPPTTFDPNATPLTYDGQHDGDPSGAVAGNCTDPENPTVHGLKPGNYSQISLANGQRLWLCPGVFHLVHPSSGSTTLSIDSPNAVVAGQGVTLAFESDAPLKLQGSSGTSPALLMLDTASAGGTVQDAPWTTGWSLHDVPIAIWVRPVPDCDPLAATPCSDSSNVFQMGGSAGIDERGIIYAPTDNVVIGSANTDQVSSSGELWAWTLKYNGQSSLDQTYDGPDVSYPILVQ